MDWMEQRGLTGADENDIYMFSWKQSYEYALSLFYLPVIDENGQMNEM